MNNLGRHVLVEYYDCNVKILNNSALLEQHMREAVVESGATIINTFFHQFEPHGVSGVVMIAESHMSIHTWPEYGYAALDFFTCGKKVNPWKAIDYVSKRLNSARSFSTELKRGLLDSKLGVRNEAVWTK